MRFAVFLVLLSLLTGCASLSEDECLAGNWDEIGFRDGTEGRTSAYLQRHAKACEKVDVVPVGADWEAGRQRGLPVYCTPDKAYSEGRAGRDLSPVCPASQVPFLQSANDKGQEFFRLTREIAELREEIRELEQAMIAEREASRSALLLARIQLKEAQILATEARRRQFSRL